MYELVYAAPIFHENHSNTWKITTRLLPIWDLLRFMPCWFMKFEWVILPRISKRRLIWLMIIYMCALIRLSKKNWLLCAKAHHNTFSVFLFCYRADRKIRWTTPRGDCFKKTTILWAYNRKFAKYTAVFFSPDWTGWCWIRFEHNSSKIYAPISTKTFYP